MLGRFLALVGLNKIAIRIDIAIGKQREAMILRLARQSDIVFLQKTKSFNLISQIRKKTTARIIYDLNDGLWLPKFSSFFGGANLGQVLALANAVTCDNPFGLEQARKFNANVFLVPDPPQVEQFDRVRASVQKDEKKIIIGWVGSPATLFNLYAIWEPLEMLFAKYASIDLRILGSGYQASVMPCFEKVRITKIPYYSHEQMIQEVLKMHIGLFPLFDIEDSRARGILKATIYMSGGACVVSSPIGQICDIIIEGENGFLAKDKEEWVQKISTLIEDKYLRNSISKKALETIRRDFSLESCYKKNSKAVLGN
jgi:glycosyltransferase involved in cell wall biosynthesis